MFYKVEKVIVAGAQQSEQGGTDHAKTLTESNSQVYSKH